MSFSPQLEEYIYIFTKLKLLVKSIQDKDILVVMWLNTNTRVLVSVIIGGRQNRQYQYVQLL